MKKLLLPLLSIIVLNIITAQKPLRYNVWTQDSDIQIKDIFKENIKRSHETILTNAFIQTLSVTNKQRSNWLRSHSLFQLWDNSWFDDSQKIYTYNENNNLTSYIRQNWDGTQWVNDQNRIYTYNENNNQTSYIRQNWDGTQWVNSFQAIYTYDENNNLKIES